ncbi:MAG: DNA polymerase I [Williamsia sp.]|nr:DNA polymerase I [Williamsia sp.]
MKDKKLFLLDVMPLLYRAHFATMGKRFGTTTGIDTRTPLVFFNYIFQVLTDEKPDAVAAALDSKSKRTDVATTYKANRQKMPSEITAAFPYAMQLLESLRVPVLKEEGREADDIIAAVAKQGAEQGYQVFIVSPDKDLAQLVRPDIFLYRPAYKGAVMETLDTEGVKNKWGVEPSQIADYLALRGDSVDNITGIKGIGDKTAAQLLNEFRSVEELIERAGTIKQPKIQEAILENRDQLLQNKQLTVLAPDLDVAIDWNTLGIHKPDPDKLLPLLEELQFEKMRERLVKQGFLEEAQSTAAPAETPLVTVVQVEVEAVLKKAKAVHEIGIGFLEPAADRLFLLPAGSREIWEVQADDAGWERLIRFLDQQEITKWGWQLKPFLKRIGRLEIGLKTPWIDLSLAAYLLEPDAKIEWRAIRDKYALQDFRVEAYDGNLAYLPSLQEAHKKIMDKIGEMGLTQLFFEIEQPLEPVIAAMELHGIGIDLPALKEIGGMLNRQLQEMEKKLYEEAGVSFNPNSPSQTADVLQQIAEASELKKTKTGQISTAEPFLAELAPKYPFVAHLLDYRKLNKIITTYVEALPRYVNPVTGSVHPIFQQLVAGTGRLSCTEPNLQNLPVRSEAGREVRKAIVPSEPGYSILSADYNQVELRLLASLSGDEVMIDAFRSGKDIHAITASRVFKVEEKKVTKDMRRKAKEVNFGIAYGITPWGLATRLKISQKEAKKIIDAYFEEFSSVKNYLEKSVEESRERGYTRTPLGRIRYIEGIDSRNGTTRKAAERVAVNAPLQGFAADIIKAAMVAVHQYIIDHQLQSRLILQVHDELVFDAADKELPSLVPELVRIMEAGPELKVPLRVNVTVGRNWLDQVAYT